MTDTALWNPFRAAAGGPSGPLVIDRAEGVRVWDVEGRSYLDATAGLWYSNFGHGRPEIASAVAEQLERLDAFSLFGDYSNPPAERLAARLAELASGTCGASAKVFLGSGGGDMVETAAKLARKFHAESGSPQRAHLIGRTYGYHGTHGIGTGVGGIEANRVGFGELVGSVSRVAHDDAAALEAEIERVGPDRVAAFFCEPVIGAGGVRPPVEGYIEAVAEICRRHGVLFVADCVICGFGRLGTWLGIDRWDVRPDMIILAKGLTGGTLPLGALIVSDRVAEPFFADGASGGAASFKHGVTYAGHPTCCAAANASLDIYEREDLIPRGRELEGVLAGRLSEALGGNPLIGEIRAGTGLMAGVDLAADLLAEEPAAATMWPLDCREAGVLVRPLGAGIAVSPPLICSEQELEELAQGVAKGLATTARRLGRVSPVEAGAQPGRDGGGSR